MMEGGGWKIRRGEPRMRGNDLETEDGELVIDNR